MKIERGNMRITEVPHVYCIDVSNIDCEIKFTDFVNPITFTKEQLQEFHAAFGEALKYMKASSAENSTEPRTWREGDPEPGDVTVVIDCDGDRWVKETYSGVTEWRYGGTVCDWGQLLCGYEPVREAK